jgi:hypothetical protein
MITHYVSARPSTFFPETNIESIPKPLWNFWSADWQSSADHVAQFIPTCSDAYARFSNANKAAAKRNVSRGFRKEFMPGWEHNFTHDNITANPLLDELNKQQKK